MENQKQPVIPRLQASLLFRSCSEIEMAFEFIEDAVRLLQQVDREDYPEVNDHIEGLKSMASKLDTISATLNKAAGKRSKQ